MSFQRSSEDEVSLAEAMEEVSHCGHAQTKAMTEKQATLSSLQATLSDTERKVEAAEQELRSKVREVLVLEDELEQLQQQRTVLHDRCASISQENTQLHLLISKQAEDAQVALARFNAYRSKMEAHRAAVLEAASQTEAYKELEEKKAVVQTLKKKKEELQKDLENPDGTIQKAKREMDALKEEISVRRRLIAERREQLKGEQEVQASIKKDIQIQNRRYEAIMKRLSCQLSRTQAAHWQTSNDIYHMRRQLDVLRGQQDAADWGQ